MRTDRHEHPVAICLFCGVCANDALKKFNRFFPKYKIHYSFTVTDVNIFIINFGFVIQLRCFTNFYIYFSCERKV